MTRSRRSGSGKSRNGNRPALEQKSSEFGTLASEREFGSGPRLRHTVQGGVFEELVQVSRTGVRRKLSAMALGHGQAQTNAIKTCPSFNSISTCC